MDKKRIFQYGTGIYLMVMLVWGCWLIASPYRPTSCTGEYECFIVGFFDFFRTIAPPLVAWVVYLVFLAITRNEINKGT